VAEGEELETNLLQARAVFPALPAGLSTTDRFWISVILPRNACAAA
jgi:hypothetical protein